MKVLAGAGAWSDQRSASGSEGCKTSTSLIFRPYADSRSSRECFRWIGHSSKSTVGIAGKPQKLRRHRNISSTGAITSQKSDEGAMCLTEGRKQQNGQNSRCHAQRERPHPALCSATKLFALLKVNKRVSIFVRSILRYCKVSAVLICPTERLRRRLSSDSDATEH